MDITIWDTTINLLAVLVAGLLSVVIGFLWYIPQSPTGKLWLQENKFKEKDLNPNPVIFIIQLVLYTGLAFVLAYLLGATQATTILGALRVTVMVWAAFVFTGIATINMFTMRSLKLTFVDTLYILVTKLAMGTLLFYWE